MNRIFPAFFPSFQSLTALSGVACAEGAPGASSVTLAPSESRPNSLRTLAGSAFSRFFRAGFPQDMTRRLPYACRNFSFEITGMQHLFRVLTTVVHDCSRTTPSRQERNPHHPRNLVVHYCPTYQ